MLNFNDIKNNETINTYIKKADEVLLSIGYTEHSFAHVTKVSETAAYILTALNYSKRDIELARIAGYMHDIGNIVNRDMHSQTGAVIAYNILTNIGMEALDIADIVSAIGNHDEGTGAPINAITAALIIADKTDVRRSRVRNQQLTNFDIHDRVNYSVESSSLIINSENNEIILELKLDTKIGSVMDYFEIFLGRMDMCRKAAEKLGLKFSMSANGQRLI